MAQRGIQLDSAKFCCSICVDLLKDPVTIPCGHSYCMSCLKRYWDREEQREIPSCPQCRQTFTPRPVLGKNTMLAEIVEEMKKTGLQAAPPDLCYAGPGDVACDVCTGRKRKALKSCLVCPASYCEQHLQPHYDAPPLKKHKLVEATVQLQENICSRHNEVMKIFCRTDQQCICYLCSMDEHKGHHTVSAAAERTERQKELGLSRQKIQQRIQVTEKDVKVLQQEVEAIKRCSDEAVENCEKTSTELMSLIKKRWSDLIQEIRSQQKEVASRAEELQEKLKQEIVELRRKDAELKQLSHTEDHIHFLHNYPSLSLQDLLSEEWSKISLPVTGVDVPLPQPEPKTRAEFLQYSCQITLDPNTAHTRLLLSEGNRKVTQKRKDQSYPRHPDRFTERHQVLSRESLTGRCYWEVEWFRSGVSIAVAYKDISRTGDESQFGSNDKSWTLDSLVNEFRHNSIKTPTSVPESSRVGVESETVRRSLSLTSEMAQRGNQSDLAKFYCSSCLDLLEDPVTIPCGHSYCMSCIESCWDEEEQMEIHSCPQCRQTAEIVEGIEKMGLQDAPPVLCYAGPGDVACDVCTGRKLKALQSCLVCLKSYCGKHLHPHYDAAPLTKHKLVEATVQLQKNICSDHHKVMKIFCRTDQQCICNLCSMDEHKGHHTVSAAAERKERQKELGLSRQKIQQRIQDTEKDVKVLQQEVEAINRSAEKAVEDSEKIFTELRSDVRQQIRSQQKEEASRAEEVQEKLKQEIAELRRKDAELEQLSHTEDHIHFLHNYPSLSRLSESTHSPSNNIRPLSYFEDVTAAVSELREKLQDLPTEEWSKTSLTGTGVDVLLPQPEPKTRAEFLQYSCQITLDPNTAHTRLSLSEGNRKVTEMEKDQSYPRHPDRFTERSQVLSRESLTGRHYWEVERRGSGVSIAVTYKNISRTGNESQFGFNAKSWTLYCSNNQFRHYSTPIPTLVPVSSRVGVYLDHRAGILSFYNVSETMTLLYRVQTIFTQPLHAGILVYLLSGDSAEFCQLK
ncbi:E3 ubiquitin/ISG15 ligase TRIM25-like [Myripristis murdjan]|uniref:E3 ubiquitin/ISG15 ligase TRIM25-like n=1 Tax=Myripristis murdjan TaxID=586833 RepID=UPI001175E0CE|nr:E3 ubiquitin/ISG15 ligase TRIM25-like [Myripristis murdjan]